jgi:uncharacterized membrane protein
MIKGEPMSELIVIGYDNQGIATQAYNQVLALNKDFVVTLNGLALVTVDAEGRSHVETPQKIVGVSAVIMASKITEDKFGDAMRPYGGELLKTSLSEDDEKVLAADLAESN